ncbi:MAG: PilZ domain-containing protein [Vicinamibacterales bacterium]
MSDNKRDSERVPVVSLNGEVKVYQPMAILDISVGGAQVETPFPLQLDSLHDFRISLADQSLVLKGRIAYCHIGELKEGVVLYRSGVEFVEMSDHVQAALEHFVKALKEAQQRPPIVDGQIAGEV